MELVGRVVLGFVSDAAVGREWALREAPLHLLPETYFCSE
jgi:hypothetical protein